MKEPIHSNPSLHCYRENLYGDRECKRSPPERQRTPGMPQAKARRYRQSRVLLVESAVQLESCGSHKQELTRTAVALQNKESGSMAS